VLTVFLNILLVVTKLQYGPLPLIGFCISFLIGSKYHLVVHFLEYEIQLLQETLAKLAQTKTHTMKKKVLPGRIETLSWRIATASLYLHQKSAYSFVSNYSGESLF